LGGGGGGLAMRRLSIIDVAGGAQPVYNEDGSAVIVYNGEVYNSPELHEELEARGHKFRSHSDTEVLVHLWEEKGEKMLEDLRGMFAFAIWDVRRRELLLARDRMGKKPLYWAIAGNWLAFASELKSLRAHPGIRAEVDADALRLLLALQYIPSPRTPFRGVNKLPPGHLLTVRGGRTEVKRWWRLSPRDGGADYAGAVREVRRKLEESVRMRLLSEVPLGALLSGGLDSSAVVALMAGMGSGPVKTFTVAFDTPGGKADAECARMVAARYRTEHLELPVGEEEALSCADAVFSSLDEPILDPACLPTYLVSRLARQKVTVALTGEGGDESFAGYLRYRLARMPAFPVPGARPLVDALEDAGLARARTAKAVWAATEKPGYARHLYSAMAFAPGRYRRLFGPAGLDAASAVFRPLFESYGGPDRLNRTLAADLETWLSDDLLQKVDRMSMAVSLEARTPLLDHTLQEYLHGLPGSFKLGGGSSKRIFRDAVRNLLPPEILSRKKVGFEPPWGEWFRGRLREPLRDALASSSFASFGFIDRRQAARLADAHERTGKFGLEMFCLYALAEWGKRHASSS